METHPFVRDAASHFPQKLRSQLLLEGRALKQSAGGGSERRGGNGGDDWSHSDIGTVPPLHPHLLRPRHWGGGVHLRPELQFQFHCPVAVRTFFLSPQSLYLVLELTFPGTPLYLADRFTGDHTRGNLQSTAEFPGPQPGYTCWRTARDPKSISGLPVTTSFYRHSQPEPPNSC